MILNTFIAIILCLSASMMHARASEVGLGNTDLGLRRLLATRWKQCKIEKRTKYEGTPMRIVRDVKRSHDCCVQCKGNPSCDRWTYLPEYRKCSLFSKTARNMFKRKARWYISGYASWRLEVKSWPKEKRQSSNYVPPMPSPPPPSPELPWDWYMDNPDASPIDPYTPEPSCYGLPGDCIDSGQSPYNPPAGDIGWMKGKSIYGRRLNSVLPCVGNRASSSGRCRYLCQEKPGCMAWTWAGNSNCRWIGEQEPTGLCYLLADVDTGDVFSAPEGDKDNFVSGFLA